MKDFLDFKMKADIKFLQDHILDPNLRPMVELWVQRAWYTGQVEVIEEVSKWLDLIKLGAGNVSDFISNVGFVSETETH